MHIKSQISVNNLLPVIGLSNINSGWKWAFPKLVKWNDTAQTQNEKWTFDAKLRLLEQLTDNKWSIDMKLVWRDHYSIYSCCDVEGKLDCLVYREDHFFYVCVLGDICWSYDRTIATLWYGPQASTGWY